MLNKKKFISVWIAAILAISLLGISVLATPTNPNDTWDKHASANFAGGTGTKDDPYQIATGEQLAKLAKDVNSGVLGATHRDEFFILTENIDLSQYEWIPIGRGPAHSSFQSFQGYLNGNGKTITGLYVDESETGYVAGLFGHVTQTTAAQDAAIKDLKITNAFVKTSNKLQENLENGVVRNQSSAGILAGSFINEGVKVLNCEVSGTVEAPRKAGGLVGYSSYSTFENCSANVTVQGEGVSGGFVGEAYQSTYNKCSSKGTVNGGWSTGGFAGILYFNTNVDQCASETTVTAWDWNTGGFAGYVEEKVTIKDSVAYGDVTNTLKDNQPKTGGFVGTNMNSTIQNSSVLGTVTSNSNNHPAGGFVGYDISGNTAGCSFDKTKNHNLTNVGETQTQGKNEIVGLDTSETLHKVCENYYKSHDISNVWVIDVQPTCTTEGSKSQHCTRCDEKFNVTVIPAEKHNAIKVGAKAPTCTENGNIEYWHCKTCDKYFKDAELKTEITLQDTILAATHDAVKVEAKAPTCTENGNIEYWHCKTCGTYFKDAELKTEITLQDTILAATHDAVKVEAKAPTCTENGNIEYWHCKTCGTYFKDAELKTEITLKDTIIPMVAHNYVNGVCTVCGAVDPTYKPIPPINPPDNGNGQSTPSTPVPPQTGGNNTFTPTAPSQTDSQNSSTPKTGDSTNLIAWVVLFFMSFGFVSVTVVYLKQIKNK